MLQISFCLINIQKPKEIKLDTNPLSKYFVGVLTDQNLETNIHSLVCLPSHTSPCQLSYRSVFILIMSP